MKKDSKITYDSVLYGVNKDYDHNNDKCPHADSSWCNLPKYKHCKFCLRLKDGSKACELAL